MWPPYIVFEILQVFMSSSACRANVTTKPGSSLNFGAVKYAHVWPICHSALETLAIFPTHSNPPTDIRSRRRGIRTPLDLCQDPAPTRSQHTVVDPVQRPHIESALLVIGSV